MIRLESEFCGKRIPLQHTLTKVRDKGRQVDAITVSSQCMQVSVAAPIIIVCDHNDVLKCITEALFEAGYKTPRVERKPAPPQPVPPPPWYLDPAAFI